MRKKTKIALIALAAAVVALVAVLVILNVTKPGEPEKESPTLLPAELLGEDDPGERIEKTLYLLIFPRTDRENIATITVSSERGEYTLVKNGDGSFYLRELPEAPLKDEQVAAAVVAAGYTLVRDRVVDSATDEELAEYGLDSPSAYWTVKNTRGREYRIEVGDRMVSGDGYYCRFAGRRAVYALGNSLDSSLLVAPESFVTAAMTYGITQNNYFDIENFAVLHGDDFFVVMTECDDDEKFNPDAIVEAKLAYPEGYRANDSFFINVLGGFVSMAGDETAAIVTDESDYAKFGLDEPAYAVHFTLEGTDHSFYFSDVMEDGYMYGISDLLDYLLIARFSPDKLSWLRTGLFSWVSVYPMTIPIGTVDAFRIVTGDRDVAFTLKHGVDERENATLEATSDVVSFPNDDIYNFRQFYKAVIASKLKGDSSLTEEERAAVTADPSRAIIRFIFTRGGEQIEYGFYRATTREALFTVNGRADFYINIDWAEKLVSDLERLIAGLDIDAYGKD